MEESNKCASIKSKKENHLQCPFKKIKDTHYCGRHQNNQIIFNKTEYVQIPNINDLLLLIENKVQLSVFIIRKSIQSSYLKKIICTHQSKKVLIEKLKDIIVKERHYLNREIDIVKIQSCIRKWLIRRRYKCFNEVEILSMESKMDIPAPYFYILEKKSKKYAYDIRLLKDLIESNYPDCPYTFEKFSDTELDKIKKYVNRCVKEGIIVEEPIIISEEEKMENKVKDLFYEINMLDNYTSHKWFMDLGLHQLIKFYMHAEDIWNYRSSLSVIAKQNIIGTLSLFNIPVSVIRREKSIKKLRLIMIDIIDKMISNGIDVNEKKLGAILMLSALVEVSDDAAFALPHLRQM
jgi:hypothetical protein